MRWLNNSEFIRASNSLTKSDRRLIGRRVLKDGNKKGGFPRSWKESVSEAFIYCLERIKTSSGAHFSRSITGIPLGPHALLGSRLEMTAETMGGVICISPNRSLVLSRKSRNYTEMDINLTGVESFHPWLPK